LTTKSRRKRRRRRRRRRMDSKTRVLTEPNAKMRWATEVGRE
jgi:hypothetical protein